MARKKTSSKTRSAKKTSRGFKKAKAKVLKFLKRRPRVPGRRRAAPQEPRAGKVSSPADVNPFVQRAERFVPSQDTNGAAPTVAPSQRRQDLPDHYGDNLIYLLVRDPRWLYAYWEIQRDHQNRVLGSLGGNWDGVRSILRVYDGGDKSGSKFFDINLQGLASDWYIEVWPNRSYVVEIGLLHRDGRFASLARSNEVTTPRDGMSDVLDEEWMAVDFDKIYALSGGFQVGKSSAELQKLMQERLKGAVTSGSGGMASPTRPPEEKGFWFLLDCELVVYGATEPDAAVTIQGKKIALRPDGTFTARYALPDGRIVVDARAVSTDGSEERSIIPIVERKTRRPEPASKEPSSAAPAAQV